MLGVLQTNTNKVVSKLTVQHIYITIQSCNCYYTKTLHNDRLAMEDSDYSSKTHNHKQEPNAVFTDSAHLNHLL